MKKPPLNKFFTTVATWYSYSTDGDSYEHGPEKVIAVRYRDNGSDYYSFAHRGQAYRDEMLGDFEEWELLESW